MSQENSSSYFFTPYDFHPMYPLFIFLPGMDETGKELMCLQTAGLETAFDVRCFVIPPDELTSWNDLAEKVVTLTQSELERTPRSSVYLCGESFGGCIVLKILEKFPQLFTRVILINCGSSFSRVSWLNFGSLLFSFTPAIFYKIFSFVSLPFLASLNRLSSTAQKALLDSVCSVPKKTANQRLCLLREFKVDETKLSQIVQPVLLIASKNDHLLPSEDEAKRLAKIFYNSRLVILPNGGHACLVEEDIHLIKVLRAENF
ncbi:alpha/beta fold hydrolase [Scytonema sp. UIC 10036]|uniref:alpha/beta fold hydrolase n=1 Tax=Scytonema sp. UIC 10036 TaxID=2304196 RepID=UPI0012DAE12E|nr:alpha/beta hydrolase [Scytonema sp. UIC 10036]MUG91417.1 alpha/beta fold hydrolase [Scytonema sp. UIC 10036]